MGEIIKGLRERAKKQVRTIVFPEANDDRVVEAVDYVNKEKIANALLLTPDNLDLDLKEKFAIIFHERKQAKGISFEEAREIMENPLYYAAMMVKYEGVDGFVAGASSTTSSVIKAALDCLDIDKVSGTISSCFIMEVPDCQYGEEGVFVYTDCGVIPYPSSDQLANIALSSARFTQEVLEITPRVALLSFSTKGSAKGRWVDKIKEAVEIAKEKNSGFLIDGELQADSALEKKVASRKLSESDVAGSANVLVFPNLDAGNIAYKLTQRLAKARAIGPIVLGTKQPCSDLSRGCEVEDIVDCAAVTALRAHKKSD